MREKSFDSINVVPFIDIMLVLLTIVLATATFIKTGAIPIKLPEVDSQTSVDDNKGKNIIITISKEGEFYFENEKTSLENIKNTLAKLDIKKDTITVWADKTAQIQPFASLMGILNVKGFEKINLKTEIE